MSMKRSPVGKRPRATKSSKKRSRAMPVNANSAMPKVSRANVAELKYVDVPPGVKLVNTTPVFTLMNYLSLGNGVYQHEMRRVKAKSFYFTWFFFPIRTIAATDYARILIVWQGTSSAAPTIAEILASVDSSGTVTSTSTDLTSRSAMSKIKVLKDIRVRLDPVTVTAGVLTNNAGPASQASLDRLQGEVFIPLKDALVEFNDGAAGTIADFNHGSIYVVTLGSVASGSEGYSVNFSSRFIFSE